MAEATALFTRLDDDRLQATDLARGPWDPRALHGGPVAALVAGALEAALVEGLDGDRPASAGIVPARFVLELERPVGLDPVSLATRLTRPGRSVRTAEAELVGDDGRRLARASLTAIRALRAPLDLTQAVLPDDAPPAPAGPAEEPGWEAVGRAFHRDAVEHHFVQGRFEDLGPAIDWISLVVPVVDGEEPSPLQRAAAAADFGNGISAAVPHATHTFINPDLVIVLERPPAGDLIGLQATTRVEATGVGHATSVLWDAHGRVGTGSQTLVVDAR